MVRLGGEDPSEHFIDRTGDRGFGGGGMGGSALGCLLPLVLSRFGIGGVLILLLGYCALTQLGGGGGGILTGGGGNPALNAPSGQSTLTPEARGILTALVFP